MVEKIMKNHEVVTTEQEKKEGYIRDFISGDWVKDKPEEHRLSKKPFHFHSFHCSHSAFSG